MADARGSRRKCKTRNSQTAGYCVIQPARNWPAYPSQRPPSTTRGREKSARPRETKTFTGRHLMSHQSHFIQKRPIWANSGIGSGREGQVRDQLRKGEAESERESEQKSASFFPFKENKMGPLAPAGEKSIRCEFRAIQQTRNFCRFWGPIYKMAQSGKNWAMGHSPKIKKKWQNQ